MNPKYNYNEDKFGKSFNIFNGVISVILLFLNIIKKEEPYLS